MRELTPWQIERAAARAKQVDLCHAVAVQLAGWVLSDPPSTEDADYRPEPRLINPTFPGQAIGLSYSKGRITISGYWPQRTKELGSPWMSPSDVRESSPSITVSSEKSPAKIAQDILRRFLPEYQRIHGLLVARRDADANYKNNQQANLENLIGQGHPLFRQAHNNERSTFSMSGDGYGHLQMSGEHTVTFELRSLPMPLALAIVRLLVEGDA